VTVLTAVSRASLKVYTRDVAAIFFSFAFPLIFLVIFGLVFGRMQVAETGNAAVDFIAPGVLSWGMANAAVFGIAFTLMQWRKDDLLRLIRLTPARIIDLVLARFVVALIIALLQGVLFIGVAILPPFGMTIDAHWPLALPILVLAVTAFLSLGLIIGIVAKTPESVAAIANIVMIPMAFLSGSFVPLALMPEWLRAFSYALPLRYVGDGMVYAFAGEGGAGTYGIACLALAGFTVVFTAIGLRIFKWSNDE